jgi:hypothetical protein
MVLLLRCAAVLERAHVAVNTEPFVFTPSVTLLVQEASTALEDVDNALEVEQAVSHSSLAPWLPGSLAPWLPGSLAPWLPGSLAPWLPGSLAPWLPLTYSPSLTHSLTVPSLLFHSFPPNRTIFTLSSLPNPLSS